VAWPTYLFLLSKTFQNERVFEESCPQSSTFRLFLWFFRSSDYNVSCGAFKCDCVCQWAWMAVKGGAVCAVCADLFA